jgi:hypothetical protein
MWTANFLEVPTRQNFLSWQNFEGYEIKCSRSIVFCRWLYFGCLGKHSRFKISLYAGNFAYFLPTHSKLQNGIEQCFLRTSAYWFFFKSFGMDFRPYCRKKALMQHSVFDLEFFFNIILQLYKHDRVPLLYLHFHGRQCRHHLTAHNSRSSSWGAGVYIQ